MILYLSGSVIGTDDSAQTYCTGWNEAVGIPCNYDIFDRPAQLVPFKFAWAKLLHQKKMEPSRLWRRLDSCIPCINKWLTFWAFLRPIFASFGIA
mmetsp:Transcript_17739/g.43773  ORF Transcript_17739/g.43773 Transcript_17739/m.43773 type:complete len:95 (-) Transcript_17739:593-877(-)